jgi:hypothetical protein
LHQSSPWDPLHLLALPDRRFLVDPLRLAILLDLVNLPDPLNPWHLLDLVNPWHLPVLLALSRRWFQLLSDPSRQSNPLLPSRLQLLQDLPAQSLQSIPHQLRLPDLLDLADQLRRLLQLPSDLSRQLNPLHP